MRVENAVPGAPVRRRAKIVATVGPASNNEAVFRSLVRAGLDVARLNFSHGTHETHSRDIELIRRVAREEGKHICILQDLQGPKIRTGRLAGGQPVTLAKGAHVVITNRDVDGTAELISTAFPLAREVVPGARVLLSDGLIELRVLAVREGEVEAEVVNGGVLGERQGINLPGATVGVPSLTEKDRADLAFGLAQGVDAVALSFVRSADDIAEIRRVLAQAKSTVPVVAKLEKPQAIEHLDSILDAADAVMVARGDLGVEIPPEQVPVIQKRIIARANAARKPVITATQMLESMINNPRPTRAEASDVANAIFDGSDAVMLSGETAKGKYPREAVEIMARIICDAESHMDADTSGRRHGHVRLSVPEAICEAVAHAAHDVDMRAIALFTESGRTAQLMSKHRPRVPVFAFADTEAVCKRMAMLWGTVPVLSPTMQTADEMIAFAERELLKEGLVRAGDVIGVVTGTKLVSGFTNSMRLHSVEG